jgi:hypothetical protein
LLSSSISLSNSLHTPLTRPLLLNLPHFLEPPPRRSRSSILMRMQRIRTISIYEARVKAKTSSLVSGPEVEDESREEEGKDQRDGPFKSGGDGFDDACAARGSFVGVPDASADDAARGEVCKSERERKSGGSAN